MNARTAPFRMIAASLLLIAAASVQAQQDQHVSTAVGDAFAAQQAEILHEMERGGRYFEIGNEDRKRVLASLEQMAAVLEGRDRIEDLSPEERVVVFNAQGEVNTLLTVAAEWSREECRRERKVGTHFRRTTCYTVAEWTRQREQAQDEMNQKQRGTKCTQQNAPQFC